MYMYTCTSKFNVKRTDQAIRPLLLSRSYSLIYTQAHPQLFNEMHAEKWLGKGLGIIVEVVVGGGGGGLQES